MMCAGKRRRRRPSGSEDNDEDGTRSGSNSGGGNGSLCGMWTPRHLGDLKVSSIYNRNSAEAPAEVTRIVFPGLRLKALFLFVIRVSFLCAVVQERSDKRHEAG